MNVTLSGAEIVSSPLLWQLMQDWCAPVDLAFGAMPGAASLEREQLGEVVYVAEQILRRPWWVAEAICTNLLKVFSIMLEAMGGAILKLETTAPLELAGRIHTSASATPSARASAAASRHSQQQQQQQQQPQPQQQKAANSGAAVAPSASSSSSTTAPAAGSVELVRVTIPALSAEARPQLGPPSPTATATATLAGRAGGGDGRDGKPPKDGGRDGGGHGRRRGSFLSGGGQPPSTPPPPSLGRRETTTAAGGGAAATATAADDDDAGGGVGIGAVGAGGAGGVGGVGGDGIDGSSLCGAQLELTLETRGPLRVRVPRMSAAQFARGRKGLKDAALTTGAPHYYDDSSLLPAMAEMREAARERQRALHEERARRRLDHAARFVQRFHRNSLRHRRPSLGGPAQSFFSAVHRLSQHSYVRHSMAGPALARFARDGRRSVVGAPRRRWSPLRSLLQLIVSVVAYVTGVCTFVLAVITDLALLPVTLPLAVLGLRPLSFARGGGAKAHPVRRRRGRGYIKQWRDEAGRK